MKQIGGKNVSDFLKNALKTCITDKLCCSINRTGADKKRRFIGAVESLIFDGAYFLFPTATESSMTTLIAKHLKKSKDRYFATRKRNSSLTSDLNSPVRKIRKLNTELNYFFHLFFYYLFTFFFFSYFTFLICFKINSNIVNLI